ncbi:MAG TPA: nicotinate (nicotinamide) nucleotide adenylyltransferase [Chitinophagales bacterium]|nr:nicotinate (nicotinamide) nucleotide adenylyltransferase [Chitinophagales bacterium]HNL83609.1 nicotinate (nicotinamide) nucleotide adenylyltransferase [Chitinophagales bacterium]
MKVGLFFGSFNPVHIGHLLVATRMREAVNLDEIWFVLSPQNPFKLNAELADEQQRLEMLNLSINDIDYFKVCTLEFELDKPSYTHITLKTLKKQYPEIEFKLIIGEDNVNKFQEWKEAKWISDNIEILVYARKSLSDKNENESLFKMKKINYGYIDISSTEIRQRIKENKLIDFYVEEKVKQYIMFHKLYQF